MAVAITVECHWIFRTRGKFSLNYQNPAVARRKWQIWRMFTPTAKESILRAARKSDEMLEPYEWKRSRTVLRRERAGNRPDLADYTIHLLYKIRTIFHVTCKNYLCITGCGKFPAFFHEIFLQFFRIIKLPIIHDPEGLISHFFKNGLAA